MGHEKLDLYFYYYLLSQMILNHNLHSVLPNSPRPDSTCVPQGLPLSVIHCPDYLQHICTSG